VSELCCNSSITSCDAAAAAHRQHVTYIHSDVTRGDSAVHLPPTMHTAETA
jgi:hypothetical protein